MRALRRILNYIYLILAGILLLAMVVEFRRGPDVLNVVLYGIALALSVALFEIRRRQFNATHPQPEEAATTVEEPSQEDQATKPEPNV